MWSANNNYEVNPVDVWAINHDITSKARVIRLGRRELTFLCCLRQVQGRGLAQPSCNVVTYRLANVIFGQTSPDALASQSSKRSNLLLLSVQDYFAIQSEDSQIHCCVSYVLVSLDINTWSDL